jgi:hypothetical protein
MVCRTWLGATWFSAMAGSQLGEPDSVISRKMVVLDSKNGGNTMNWMVKSMEQLYLVIPLPLQLLLNVVADELYSHHF